MKQTPEDMVKSSYSARRKKNNDEDEWKPYQGMSGSTSDNPFKNPSSANTATAPKCILLFSHSDNQIPSTSSVDFLKPSTCKRSTQKFRKIGRNSKRDCFRKCEELKNEREASSLCRVLKRMCWPSWILLENQMQFSWTPEQWLPVKKWELLYSILGNLMHLAWTASTQQ